MDVSCDPEIICVFCGLEFTSVENVELHINHNHQSSSIDQIENKKTCTIDDYADQTQFDGNFFMTKEIKETNLDDVQNKSKSDNSSNDPIKVIQLENQEKPDLINPKKINKPNHSMHNDPNQIRDAIFYSDNSNMKNHRESTILSISETIANLVDNKVDKGMKRSLQCQNCEKQFTLSNNLSRHRRLYCSSLRENSSFIPSSITEQSNITSSSSHMYINKPGNISKVHHERDSFLLKKVKLRKRLDQTFHNRKCPKCFKRFFFKVTQIIHSQNHKRKQRRKWNCEKCGFRYSRKRVLLRHYERMCGIRHSSNPSTNSKQKLLSESLRCNFCQMIFTDQIYFTMHQLRICHHFITENTKNYKATDNDKTNTESTDEPQKKLHLEDNIKDLFLLKDLSSKSCSTEHSISENFESESNPRSPENSSSKNDKSENITINPNQKFHWHNFDENQQKIFQCEVCKKSFSSRSSLSNHVKSHYSSRGQPFTCRDCNKRFINLLSLQDHRREMCSQKSQDSEQKIVYSLSNFNGVSQVPIWPNITNVNSVNQPVTCLHCSGVFYDRLELEEHALSKHSNEQGNILCLLCDRSFTTNMALRVHLTKSHGFANGGCPGVSQNLPPMPKLETNYHMGDDLPTKKRRKDKRIYEFDKDYACDNCHRNFSTGQALGNHKRACLNLPNECISSQTPKSNSKLHSIESLIFDNSNIRSTFTNDKNVFLAFN